MLDYVLGIVKAYTTRVGTGPVPDGAHRRVGAGLAKRGNEFGSVTGRPRRCGWLDLAALKRSLQLNGVDGLCITKLDVLDGMTEIRICTSYRVDGRAVDAAAHRRRGGRRMRAGVRDDAGLDAKRRSARAAFDALPANARAYLRRIEALTGVPIAMVSTGAGSRRDDPGASSVPYRAK